MAYACQLSELEERKPYVTEVDGNEVGLILWKNEVYAYANYCPHAGGPVCLGDVTGRVKMELDEDKKARDEYVDENEMTLVCPWHGFTFDLKTGKHISEENMSLRKYKTKVENDKVFVEVDE